MKKFLAALLIVSSLSVTVYAVIGAMNSDEYTWEHVELEMEENYKHCMGD